MTRVAIVGGGPGGLFTARFLEMAKTAGLAITLFEASGRLGGKVLTGHFGDASLLYEAGVAELYDYSILGADPLRALIETLGLDIVPMSGGAMVLDGIVCRDIADVRQAFGAATADAIEAFYADCIALCPPAAYYEGHTADDNAHAWATRNFAEVLDAIPDATARRYVAAMARSDIATEPHLTTALNGLKNVLMDDPRYMALYSVAGGIEELTRRLAASLSATDLRLHAPVTAVGSARDGAYDVHFRQDGRDQSEAFDVVIVAMPNTSATRIEWQDPVLRGALRTHLAHYEHPGHYLRVTLLFRQRFWSDIVSGSYFMTDAFGGACIYDESARHPHGAHGCLGFLLAGNDALVLSNWSDDALAGAALDALPPSLASGRDLFVEARVHRWVGSINGLPGGQPVHDLRARHLPAPDVHPNIVLVGDYLFDSTLNGTLDSADFAANHVLATIRRRAVASPESDTHDAPLGRDYFDEYDGESSYADTFEQYFSAQYPIDLIETVWGKQPPYRLLDCGSANGLTLRAFADLGVDAWGIENSPYIHAQTEPALRDRNLLGDVRHLPFEDGFFDFVYDTCLCYVPEADLEQAVAELFRVCRRGVLFMGVATDMAADVIESEDLFDSVRSFKTLWEWSELFAKAGFRVADIDAAALDRMWALETNTESDEYVWYPDKMTMRYCFYSKPADAVASSPIRGRRLVRS